MSYERRLAQALRRRHVPEEKIGEVLADVRELTAATGTPAAVEFGSVAEYAQSFPEGPRRRCTPARLASAAVLALGVAVLIVGVELQERGTSSPLPWWAVLLLWWASVPAATAVRALVDRRLPRPTRSSGEAPTRLTPRPPTAPSRGRR